MNRSAAVGMLQQREVRPRADTVRQTGLIQTAITRIVAPMMEMGIVSEMGIITGSDNRRSIELRLNADRHQIIRVKFARQVFAVGVFDTSGRIYIHTEAKSPFEEDPQKMLSAMKEQIYDMLKRYKDVVSIGFVVPEPYLRGEGRIVVATQVLAWHTVNFIEESREELNKPISTEHDVNVGVLVEWLFGGHTQPLHTLACSLVGDGMDAGIVERGRLFLGVQDIACKIGHISAGAHDSCYECGNYGCFRMYCSASVILKKVQERVPECLPCENPQNSDAYTAASETARAGNQKVPDVVWETAEYIGYGCVTLINVYNLDITILGDVTSQGGDLLLLIVQEVVGQRVIPELHTRVRIKISNLKVDPTLYSAATTATDKVLQLPSKFSTAGRRGQDR